MVATNPQNPNDLDLENSDVLSYRIYGDNIRECVKFAEMLVRVGPQIGIEPVCILRRYSNPVFILRCTEKLAGLEGILLAFHVCGRMGEWALERRPFVGHEASDVVMTYVAKPDEPGKPILSIEFNDAIPAGNNAWQRFPRIAQAAESGVPFIYSLPVCDAEVFDGKVRSLRHPNISIPVAQMILMAKYRVESFAIYGENPWYLDALKIGLAQKEVTGTGSELKIGAFALWKALTAGIEALGADYGKVGLVIKGIQKTLFFECVRDMLLQMSYFLKSDFTILNKDAVVDRKNIEEVITAWWQWIDEGKAIPKEYRFFEWDREALKVNSYPFSKSTSTASRYLSELNPQLSFLGSSNKARVVEFASAWGITIPQGTTKTEAIRLITEGPERWKRPLSYKPPANELAFIYNVEAFASHLERAYPKLDKNIIDRCRRATPPLLFLPIAGYVEDSGGVIAFSRPDKGLVGLTTALFGASGIFGDRLVLMYHQEIPKGWKQELLEAIKEMNKEPVARNPNNLWRETARLATIVVIDHLQEGWMS